jgi:predicted DNA-binding transcriptional regulator AlpA
MLTHYTKRRINVREFADRLACHPATLKRRIKQHTPGFPMPVLIMGKWTWSEDEADQYVKYLIEQSRKDM